MNYLKAFAQESSGLRPAASRRLATGFASLMKTAWCAGLFCAAGSAALAETSSFGVIFMPDTQFFSRYATSAEGSQFMNRYGSEPYAEQTKWIAAHADELGIPFVVHLGDVVDQVDKPAQWQVADTAMKTLETAGVPYSILAGNHDVANQNATDVQRNLAAEPYLNWFPQSRSQQQETFTARDNTGFHEAHIFEYQGKKFMVLALSWNMSMEAITWARGVIAANPTLPVIVSTHDALYIESDGVTARDSDYGQYLWNNLIKDNDQIFMVVNGHNHGSAHKVRANDFGHDVVQVVVDYQMSYQGGNGYLRLFEFDLTNNKIKGLTFSPWVPLKPEQTLNQFDRAVLTEPNNEYTVDMNFAERFAGFSPGFTAGPADREIPLTEAVREMILADYQDPEVPSSSEPYDTEDYPHHPATIAHWRFGGGPDGIPVADGTVIPDVTGANPLTRGARTGNAQVSDVVWSSDHHALSSSFGSVRFNVTPTNASNHFLTSTTAPINAETLTTGYTIEAFLKMDKRWTAGQNAWMSIMTRGGRRDSLPGWSGSYGDSSPLTFAISNLREFQWEITTMPSANRLQSKTNWSGEIMVDQWQHIALVNDPVTHDTTMYVAGAPVLRNVQNAIGIAGAANQPWVIASVINGASGAGFFGSISEIRVTKAALKPDQWLTARKNRVLGSGGRQTIAGTDGDDQIIGNAAADTLTGGAGSDTFVFRSLRDGVDTITDFTPGVDKLNLQGVLDSLGYLGTSPLTDGMIRVLDSPQGAQVQLNSNGSYRTLFVLKGLTAAQAPLAGDLLF